MVGNALEQDILELYSDNPSSLYSINQIATKLGKKYPYINKKVTILIKSQIFRKTVIGRSHLCSLNLKNDETIYLLILNEIRKKKKLLESNPRLREATSYICKVARLSGAEIALKDRQGLLFVTPRKEEAEALSRSIVKQALGGHEFRAMPRQEFLEMLKEDREIHSSHTILQGFEKYYECIREIEDELKLRNSRVIP